MAVPIVLDITKLLLRMHLTSPTGIDRIHLDYADQLAQQYSHLVKGIHFGMGWPRLITSEQIGGIVRASAQLQYGAKPIEDKVFSALCDWIQRRPTDPGPKTKQLAKLIPPNAKRFQQIAQYLRLAPLPGSTLQAPLNAIYLSIAQPGVWGGALRLWLQHRQSVKSVFFVHDLLPLDYPEYFPSGYQTHFIKYISTIVRIAVGFIVSTEVVARRLRLELVRYNKPNLPIHVAPLPPATVFSARPDVDLALQETPYFVVCGTIEPRKNHLMLLSLWRDLIRSGQRVPKLVIIGTRGWENEQVIDLLDRCKDLIGHVIVVSGLSPPGLKRLLSNACATLLPTFAEGYGLPLVEALSLSVPTVASDIPVCREVTQGRAVYLHPLDGPGWRDTVMHLSSRHSSTWIEAQMSAGRFRAPTWPPYFINLMDFLEKL